MKNLIIILFLFFSIKLLAQINNEENIVEISVDKLDDTYDHSKDIDQTIYQVKETGKYPLYKGCNINLTNGQRIECLKDKLSNLVTKNFDITVTNNLGLEPGKSRIVSKFDIDENGKVINIKASGDHIKLEQELIRVLKLIPQFKQPAILDTEAIQIPITFPVVLDIEEKKEIVFPTHKRCSNIVNNTLLKQCTDEKISNFIKMSVDMELADRLFPLDKSTQFKVLFTID